MKQLLLICLFMLVSAAFAVAASISIVPVVPTLQDTDRIPIGRPGGTVAYTTTPAQLLAGYRNYSAAATARNLQQSGFAAYTTGRVKLGFGNLSSGRTFTIGNHGLYMNGVAVATW